MATNTSKPMTTLDEAQLLRFVYNENEKSLSVGSFITGKIGHKITQTAFNTVTDDFSYFDGATLLQTIRVIYTNTAKDTLVSVERIV